MNKSVWRDSGMVRLGKAYVLREKSVPVKIYLSQIPHRLAWVWTQASTVRGQWLAFSPSYRCCEIPQCLGWDRALCMSKRTFTSPGGTPTSESKWQWNNNTDFLHEPCFSSYITQDRHIIYNSNLPTTRDLRQLLPPAAEHKRGENSSFTQLSPWHWNIIFKCLSVIRQISPQKSTDSFMTPLPFWKVPYFHHLSKYAS
jgi:hypothetical protein